MAYAPTSYTPETPRSLAPDQIAHLQEASLAITASLDMEEVLRRVVAAARALLRADAVVVFGLERSRSDFPVLASEGLSYESSGHSGVYARSVEAAVGKAIAEQHTVGIDDITAAPADLRRTVGFAGRQGFRSVLAAPLTAHSARLGALVLYSHEPREWSKDDAALLSLFAAQVAVALQNARLYERLDKRASDLQNLFEISHLLNSFVDRESLLTGVITRLVSWMGAKYGAVALVDRGEVGEAELKLRAHYGLSPDYIERANRPGGIPLDARHPNGNGPASVCVRESRPCAIGDVFLDERFAPFRPYALQAGYLSLVCVPLCGQGHVRGCFLLYFAQRRDFGQAELKLQETVADGVALALDRMELSERLVEDAVESRSHQETDRLKEEFVSTVSHELRTPLTIIKGYTDLLVNEQAGTINETQHKFLLGVQRNTARLTELVSDLLDISRLEASTSRMRRDRVDVGRVVADACSEYERVAAERGVAIDCRCGVALPPISGDAERLAQVVNNLLSNAVKYSPSGETVTLSSERQGTEILVTVQDRGPGIPDEAQARLFQRFYRVDSSPTRLVGGTGLGLAIAKVIVEQHGGRIWVQSKPGEGSVFGFALPLASPTGSSKDAPPSPRPQQQQPAPPPNVPENGERK